jgi:hypothetical protein
LFSNNDLNLRAKNKFGTTKISLRFSKKMSIFYCLYIANWIISSQNESILLKGIVGMIIAYSF